MLTTLIVIGVIVAVVLFAVMGGYNKLVALDQRADQSFADIDVQLKQRQDLIPNLVETVKGYATHESEVFEKATKARAEAMSAQSVGDTADAENKLTGALTDLRAVAENYPTLRATENFQQLSRNLSELEDEIQASRRIYNSNVQSYNTDIQQFPTVMFAGMVGFGADKPFFDLGEADRAAMSAAPPTVNFQA